MVTIARFKGNKKMATKLLKLDPPYQVILAGTTVGLHTATLIKWNDDDITDNESYPIVDEGEETPSGTLCPMDIHDCIVVCPPNHKTNLGWLSKVIEHDFQQLEPAGIDYIMERLFLLGVDIAMPKEKDGSEIWDFDISLDFINPPVSWDKNPYYRVRGGRHEGLYFQSEGTADEVYNDLFRQLSSYYDFFLKKDIYIKVKFHTYDIDYNDPLMVRLNEINLGI
jgi:hypothetical protein